MTVDKFIQIFIKGFLFVKKVYNIDDENVVCLPVLIVDGHYVNTFIPVM